MIVAMIALDWGSYDIPVTIPGFEGERFKLIPYRDRLTSGPSRCEYIPFEPVGSSRVGP